MNVYINMLLLYSETGRSPFFCFSISVSDVTVVFLSKWLPFIVQGYFCLFLLVSPINYDGDNNIKMISSSPF